MISGLGCDIVNIQRLEKSKDFLERFAKRILGAEELAEISAKNFATVKDFACTLAKYYAGKEAFAKAIGTGFIDGIFLRDIQILHNLRGKPELKISGSALDYLHKISEKPLFHISLSDDYPYAQAVVIIE